MRIRTPRPDEVRTIARTWLDSFRPRASSREYGQGFVRVGRASDGVAPHVWRYSHRLYIEHRLRHDAVLVADMGDEPAGFCSFSRPTEQRPILTVHYLHVAAPVRRRGVGTVLLRAVQAYVDADTPLQTTHTTAAWSAFYEALHPDD